MLGIDPTSDSEIIRRAYAARIRQAGSDTQAFIVIRAAYEAALKQQPGSAILPPPARHPVPLPSGFLTPQDFANGLVQALINPDAAATRGFLARHLTAALPLDLSAAYEIAAIGCAYGRPEISLDQMVMLKSAFGWGDITHPLMRTQPSYYTTFLKRLNAAEVYISFRVLTSRRNILRINPSKRRAARLMFGKGRPLAGYFIDRRILQLAKLHAQAVRADSPESDRYYDRARIDWLLQDRKSRRPFFYWFLLLFLPGARALAGGDKEMSLLLFCIGLAMLALFGLVMAIRYSVRYLRQRRRIRKA